MGVHKDAGRKKQKQGTHTKRLPGPSHVPIIPFALFPPPSFT